MTQRSIQMVLPLLVLAALWGCDNDTSNDVAGPIGGGDGNTCIGCHGSEQNLKDALGTSDVAMLVYNKDDG